MTDGECHGQHGESKGQRNTQKTDAQLGKCGGQHSAAATAEHQPESSYKFSRGTFR